MSSSISLNWLLRNWSALFISSPSRMRAELRLFPAVVSPSQYSKRHPACQTVTACKSLIRRGDYVGSMCIVEFGETPSTCRLSRHIEGKNDLRPGTTRPIRERGDVCRNLVLVTHFFIRLTRRKRDRAIRMNVFVESDTFLLPVLPARQRPKRSRTARSQRAIRIPLTPLLTNRSM